MRLLDSYPISSSVGTGTEWASLGKPIVFIVPIMLE